VKNKPHWLALDVLAVIVFVTIGRDNHGEGIDASGLGRTAAPFLIGIAIGWLVSSAWKLPVDAKTGAIVWATSLVLGMALRRLVFDKGTAVAFVIVAAVFLGLSLNGWRLVHRVVHRLVTFRASLNRTTQ
jgi:Protein of unknown function (DUF3054)